MVKEVVENKDGYCWTRLKEAFEDGLEQNKRKQGEAEEESMKEKIIGKEEQR